MESLVSQVARTPERERTSAALVVAAAMMVPALGAGLGMGAAPWAAASALDPSLDADGNGLHDVLDRELAAGVAGPLFLHLLYDRRPTADDARLLERDFGALRTYVFQNWDEIQVETTYDRVASYTRAPGVVGVEKFEPPLLENNVGARAIRARSAEGLPVVGGVDHAVSLHGLGYRGEGMVVAILDTGIDNGHESLDDLDDDPATNDPKMKVKPDANGLPMFMAADVSDGFTIKCGVNPVDDEGHGSHVAGTAVGTGGPSRTFQGVAPQANLLEVDISAGGVGTGTAVGFDWIISFNKGTTCWGAPGADRIDVASISFGLGGDNFNSTLNRKFTDVVRSGITFTVSGGNSGPADRTLTKGPEGAIVVAAIDDYNTVLRNDDLVASFSSRGPRSGSGDSDGDVADEFMPHVGTPGDGIMSVDRNTGNGYTSKSGTSMAAPHMGGLATLLLQANPSLRPVDQRPDLPLSHVEANRRMGDAGAVPIRDILEQTATYKAFVDSRLPVQMEATGRFGLPWNNAGGYGEVDGVAALARALTYNGVFARILGPSQGTAGVPLALEAVPIGGTPPYSVSWDLDGDSAFGDASGEAAVLSAPEGVYAVAARVEDSAAGSWVATHGVRIADAATEALAGAWTFDGPGCTTDGWTNTAASGLTSWHLRAFAADTPPCAWYHGIDAINEYRPEQSSTITSPDCYDIPATARGARFEFRVAGELELDPDFPPDGAFDYLSIRALPCTDGDSSPDARYSGPIGDFLAAVPVYETRSADLGSRIGAGPFRVQVNVFTDEFIQMEGYQVDTFRLLVSGAAPVLGAIGDKVVAEGATLSFVVAATDADGDAVRLSASGLPGGSDFDPATGLFTWTPGIHDGGIYPGVTFAASDGVLSDREAITITVTDLPGALPPAPNFKWSPVAPRTGQSVQFTDLSTDPDDSLVSFAWDFDDGATSTARHPAHAFASQGFYDVSLTVQDTFGNVVSKVKTVQVCDVNVEPVGGLSFNACVNFG